MPLSEEDLGEADTEDILEDFVEYVTKTDEEIVEEGRKNKKKSTELKLYLASNNGFHPESLTGSIEELLSSEDLNEAPKSFFQEHSFSTTSVDSKSTWLEITPIKYDTTHEFLLIDDGEYLRILTVVKKGVAEDTIEKLIKYIPELNRIFLSSEDLRDIVEVNDKRDLSGFTAKYEPFFKDEYISVQVHGGSDDTLDQVQDEFAARPKRVVFSQRNSPVEAVKGTVNQDGYASIPRVREGSGDVGVDAIENIFEACEQKDKENFEVEHRPERLTPGDHGFLTQLSLDESADDTQTDGGASEIILDADQGSVLDGMTICTLEELNEDEEYPSESGIAESLREDVLEYKQPYRYSVIGDNHFLVYDGNRGQSFEVVVTGQDLKIYSRNNTTKDGLRDFCEIIDEEFNSSYDFDKTSEKVRA
ncbi:hypothetical protein ABNG03_10130 [Halorubrum sp. RMP-47]|uniref:Uncharacterized protein n=1 Tax=Halorubrum miltondacostae TaxID=3076378 RepID=A0ABD5M0H9_9EURY